MALTFTKLYFSLLEDIELLTMEERGRLLTAMLQYALKGAVPAELLCGNERFLFPLCRRRIDQDAETYARKVEVNRVNGKKGGRPAKNPLGFSKTHSLKSKKSIEEQEEKEETEETEEQEEWEGVQESEETEDKEECVCVQGTHRGEDPKGCGGNGTHTHTDTRGDNELRGRTTRTESGAASARDLDLCEPKKTQRLRQRQDGRGRRPGAQARTAGSGRTGMRTSQRASSGRSGKVPGPCSRIQVHPIFGYGTDDRPLQPNPRLATGRNDHRRRSLGPAGPFLLKAAHPAVFRSREPPLTRKGFCRRRRVPVHGGSKAKMAAASWYIYIFLPDWHPPVGEGQ